MPAYSPIWPFVLCSIAGFALAIIELFTTFGRWLGKYWANKYVLSIIILNILTANVVYAILRFLFGIESTLWLAIITGVTFPTILRSRFTFYQPVGKDGIDTESLSITLNKWYQELQNACYEEVNSLIAGDRAKMVTRLRHCFTPVQMRNFLSDHIESEVMVDKKERHRTQLEEILAIENNGKRERRLAVLMMTLMPPGRIADLLKDCKS